MKPATLNDDLRLLAMLVGPDEPGAPAPSLSAEIHTAAEQLAAELLSGTVGLMLPESERDRLIALPLVMVRWGDRVQAMEEAARKRSRRERRWRWLPRLTWRTA